MSASPRKDSATPILLPSFVVGVVTMVLIIVAVDRIDDDVATAAAVVALIVAAGLVQLAITRLLRDDSSDDA